VATAGAVKRGNGDTPVPAAPGPSLIAIPFLRFAGAGPIELLSDAQRQLLASHASIRVFPAGTVIYRAGTRADSVFIVDNGVVKSFRDLPSGRRRIATFLFPRDLFGLAASGRYVNTVQAITPVRAYQLELETLTRLFQRDADLELQFLCKAVHVLREAQHHNIMVGRRDAIGRLAMLLRLLRQQGTSRRGDDVSIPMSRSDIANYLSLSLEAVVRASGRLERLGIVEFVGRHHARIVDQRRFAALAENV
jgi:CRP-like cAMP-binding protein